MSCSQGGALYRELFFFFNLNHLFLLLGAAVPPIHRVQQEKTALLQATLPILVIEGQKQCFLFESRIEQQREDKPRSFSGDRWYQEAEGLLLTRL